MTRLPAPFNPLRVKALTPAQIVPVLRANARALREQAAQVRAYARPADAVVMERLASDDDARADEIERTGRDPLA